MGRQSNAAGCATGELARLRFRAWSSAGAMVAIVVLYMAATAVHAQPITQTPVDSHPAGGEIPQAVELDHVVAVVADRAILQSDVVEEMHFISLQATSLPATVNTPDSALNRLIDRMLIDNERMLQPQFSTVSNQQVDASIAELKKDIPACAHGACSTSDGWKEFLQAQGFTEQGVEDRMRDRLQILKFIDWRFGSTTRTTQKEVRAYYETVLLPEFAREKKTPPPIGQLSTRIREILQQQKITGMLDEWLKSLRSQGEVHIVDPAYASVGGAA